MAGITYYDLRHVTGQVTHIDIDNGVVESGGTSFFNKAVFRVLNNAGWGILQIDNYTPVHGKKFDELLDKSGRACRASPKKKWCSGMHPTAILPVPPMKEDPRNVSIEEKSAHPRRD